MTTIHERSAGVIPYRGRWGPGPCLPGPPLGHGAEPPRQVGVPQGGHGGRARRPARPPPASSRRRPAWSTGRSARGSSRASRTPTSAAAARSSRPSPTTSSRSTTPRPSTRSDRARRGPLRPLVPLGHVRADHPAALPRQDPPGLRRGRRLAPLGSQPGRDRPSIPWSLEPGP